MKTPAQYKEEFLKRASVGFLLKNWRKRYNEYWETTEPAFVIIKDEIWSRESGRIRCHKWSEEEFKTILNARGHWKRKPEGAKKRKNLAKKYRHGRSQN